MYDVTGEQRWRDITEAYWKCAVTDRGTFCTGGQNSGEIWCPPHEFAARLGDKTQEHCTVYNMIRLADYLFRWTGESSYADYIEKNFYNGILAAQNGTTGMVAYYLPLAPVRRKSGAIHARFLVLPRLARPGAFLHTLADLPCFGEGRRRRAVYSEPPRTFPERLENRDYTGLGHHPGRLRRGQCLRRGIEAPADSVVDQDHRPMRPAFGMDALAAHPVLDRRAGRAARERRRNADQAKRAGLFRTSPCLEPSRIHPGPSRTITLSPSPTSRRPRLFWKARSSWPR